MGPRHRIRHLSRAEAECADLPVCSRRFVPRRLGAKYRISRRNVRQRRREFHCDRFYRHQSGRRRSSPNGRPSAKRHCLGIQERASFGADTNRLYIGGRSSGAHLTAVALVTDWERDYGVPTDIVKGGICSSGMYDLKAVRLSKRNSFVRFTDEMEEAMSPQRHLDQLRAPVVVTYGTNETPEFQRQARDFAAAIKAAGKSVELIEAPNYNHYEMGESFGNPYGPSGRAALALMQLPILG